MRCLCFFAGCDLVYRMPLSLESGAGILDNSFVDRFNILYYPLQLTTSEGGQDHLRSSHLQISLKCFHFMLQLFDVFCCIFQKPECIIAVPLAMFANLRTVILTLFCGTVHLFNTIASHRNRNSPSQKFCEGLWAV